VLLGEFDVLEVVQGLFESCEDEVGAVWWESSDEEVEGCSFGFAVFVVTCAHGQFVEVCQEAHVGLVYEVKRWLGH